MLAANIRRRARCSAVIAAFVTVAYAVPSAPRGDELWDLPPGVPPPNVPDRALLTPSRIELGRRLFYDTRLSRNGERACGACHRPEFAFTDTRPRAIGATGQLHDRGSMSLINVAYRGTLTWADPAMTSLERQALVPMLGEAPVELGLTGHEVRVYADLASDPMYMRLFREAFPGDVTITSETVAAALAAFERTIVSFRSPYDRYRFHGEEGVVSDSAQHGAAVFASARGGCARCHRGVNFDGDAYSDGVPMTAHGRDASDLARFRAPTLRNIAVTAPYMHDGRAQTLEEIVGASALAPVDRDDLLAFLDSLTDIDALVDSRWSDPWKTKW